MHNKTVSYFEECLRLGEWLSEADRRALYRYLLESNKINYGVQANLLLKDSTLSKKIANGEILYSLKDNVVSYSARKNGSSAFEENVRQVKLHDFSRLQIKKLNKFFAQTEVEVIWNYPLEGRNFQEEGSYCIHSYPYFDLRYFSNGRGRIVGLVNKLKIDDTDLRKKLKAS